MLYALAVVPFYAYFAAQYVRPFTKYSTFFAFEFTLQLFYVMKSVNILLFLRNKERTFSAFEFINHPAFAYIQHMRIIGKSNLR